MKRLKKFLTPVTILFFLALLIRLGFLVYHFKLSGNFQSTRYIPTSDRRDYDSIATSLLKGYGYKTPGMLAAYRPPFYPLFLTFLYSFLGHSYDSYLAVFLVQAFLSSLSVVFIFLIGKKIFNPLVGLAASLIVCFYSPLITTISDLELENLLIFMPLFFIFYLLKNRPKSGLRIKIITGLIMGLTILTKAIFLIALPVFTFLWLKLASAGKYFWKTIFIIYFSAFLIFSLWLTRNFTIYKKILYSSQQGIALFAATHPKFKVYNRQLSRIFLWESSWLDETDRNNYYTKVAIDNLKRNPLSFIKRIPNQWLGLFDLKNFPKPLHFLTILAIIGFIFSFIKKKSRAILLFSFFFLICAQYSVILGLPRFRMPFDWILILFAIFGFIELIKIGQQFVAPKSNFPVKINQLESFIAKKEVPKKIATKLQVISEIVFLTLICISLAKIVPRYFSEKTIFYPEINSKLVEESFVRHNLLKQWQLQENKKLEYIDVLDYQKSHQGDIGLFLDKLVIWQGEVNYINHNSVYPLGSAKHPKESLDPEYKGFYDMYYLLSTNYSTFSLTVNRGIKSHYYGDGVVMINYKGNLLNKLKNGDRIIVVGKVIGQNFLGQIYLEAYDIKK